jgi:gas vesicle protein
LAGESAVSENVGSQVDTTADVAAGKKRRFTMKDIFIFILGAAVGAIFALLLAPQSGQELRSKIQDTAEKDWQKVQAEWQAGQEKAQAQWQVGQEKTHQSLDQIQQTLKKQSGEGEATESEAASAA